MTHGEIYLGSARALRLKPARARVEPPASPAIAVAGPPPGCVQVVLVLVRRLRRNRLMTARTEAILPTIPAPKLLITAQTGGESRLRLPFGGSTLWAFPPSFPTHGSPQRSQGVVRGLSRP